MQFNTVISSLALTAALLASNARAGDPVTQEPPRTQAAYCEMAKNLTTFQQLALNPENLMAFRNDGGLINGGVCWWHSRLQRTALYLAIFQPEEKADDKIIKKAIRALMGADHVVVIPGYRNWRELSRDYQEYIQKKLEAAQIVGGFVQQAWIDGLMGSTHVDAEKLSKKMDQLYSHVQDGHEIVYEKLQLPGIPSHSWLVVDMIQNPRGYTLTVIDSNFLEPQTYIYERGMTSFEYPYFGPFVPYLRRDGEFHDMQVEMVRFCNPKLVAQKLKNLRAEESAEGKSDRELRSEILTDEDTQPENWSKLFP